MGFLKRGENPKGQHELAVEMRRISSSSSCFHSFILTSRNTKNGKEGEALGEKACLQSKASAMAETHFEDFYVIYLVLVD